jgi:hypothetical protein
MSDGVTVSIVSHGHGQQVADLVRQVLREPKVALVVLTLNIAEPLNFLSVDRLAVIHNPTPKGFGTNHNAAFERCQTPYFCVLNPDIVLSEPLIEALVDCLRATDSGVSAPLVLSPSGAIEDSWRRFPTFSSLVHKAFGRDSTIWHQDPSSVQSNVSQRGGFPDWVAGMCMLFDSTAYRALGGFDEGFFLYYEDVDICARVWRSGQTVVACPSVSVVHDAQRASRHNWRHMRWHATSMARYFFKYAWRLPKTGAKLHASKK